VAPSPIPPDLARERGQILRKALSGLPVELLEPLLRGVRAHADVLAPGSLHKGRGGCAIGMMLHQLRGTRPRRALRWRSPTIHEAAPDIARRYPRLAHIEFIYDNTCYAVAERLGASPCEVARDVGLWMACHVQAELDLRRSEGRAEDLPGEEQPLYVPKEWESKVGVEQPRVTEPA
jgi:hypothetical protein